MGNSDISKDVTILEFAGSLRKGSYNKAVLRAAKELAPESLNIEMFDLQAFLSTMRMWKPRVIPSALQHLKKLFAMQMVS